MATMSDTVALHAQPLTPEAFAPYGDVISASGVRASMNGARFERFDALARIDIDGADEGRAAIGIVRARSATSLPYCFDAVERHPLGSQAFIPLAPFRFLVVVAPAAPTVGPGDLRAFVTNGQQGVSYARGVWHMPLIALEAGQQFVVVDRVGGDNCDEHVFDRPVLLHEK